MANVPPGVILTELLPEPGRRVDAETDIGAEYRPAPHDRPWVYTNMIASLDGSATAHGRSAALGGPADQVVFGALRARADAIVVGLGTVLAENYRPPPVRAPDARRERGQSSRPTLVILTRSLAIPTDHRAFADPACRPLLITVTDAPAQRRRALAPHADIVTAGTTTLDIGTALDHLHQRGLRHVLLEGGPTVNGLFAAADLIDEWNLSLSPLLVGGNGPRPGHGAELGNPRRFELRRLWSGQDMLFGRWVRYRPAPGPTASNEFGPG